MKSIIPFAARIVSALLAVISTYYLTRVLGVEQFGVYSAMLSTTFFFNLFTDWGFNLYGPQMLSAFGSRAEKEGFLKDAISLKIVLSILFSCIYFLMAVFVFKNTLLYLIGLPLILLSFLNPEWVARGIMLPHFVGYRQLIFSVLNVTGFIVIYFAKIPGYTAFFLYTLNTIVSFLIVIIAIKKRKLQFSTAPFKTVRPYVLLKNTSLYFYGFLVNSLNYICGVILLEVFLSSRATGVYSSYYNILTNVITPVAITYGLFAPKFGTEINKDLLTRYYKIIGYVVLAGIVFFFNFKIFYNLFYPSSFNFEPSISTVVALVFVFYCIEYLLVIHSIFLKEPKSYFKINLLGLSVNIACNFYFIYSNQFSVRNSFICLLISQVSMCLYAISKWPSLIANFFSRDGLFSIASLLFLIVIQSIFPGIVFSLTCFFVVSVAAFRAILLLKNLY